MTQLGEFFKDGEVPTKPEDTTIKPTDKRVAGKIIKVSDEGWGFISSRDIKFTRIFFHWTSLRQDTLKFTDLKTGMKCEFTPTEVEGKGTRAIKIKILTDESKNAA
jgi:cold shock CspA family protein